MQVTETLYLNKVPLRESGGRVMSRLSEWQTKWGETSLLGGQCIVIKSIAY